MSLYRKCLLCYKISKNIFSIFGPLLDHKTQNLRGSLETTWHFSAALKRDSIRTQMETLHSGWHLLAVELAEMLLIASAWVCVNAVGLVCETICYVFVRLNLNAMDKDGFRLHRLQSNRPRKAEGECLKEGDASERKGRGSVRAMCVWVVCVCVVEWGTSWWTAQSRAGSSGGRLSERAWNRIRWVQPEFMRKISHDLGHFSLSDWHLHVFKEHQS